MAGSFTARGPQTTTRTKYEESLDSDFSTVEVVMPDVVGFRAKMGEVIPFATLRKPYE